MRSIEDELDFYELVDVDAEGEDNSRHVVRYSTYL